MEKVVLSHLMIGPLIFLLALVYKSKPNFINFLSSKVFKDTDGKEIWIEANRYSASSMLRASFVTIIFQLVSFLILENQTSLIASTAFLLLSLIIALSLTESHLRKKYLHKNHN